MAQNTPIIIKKKKGHGGHGHHGGSWKVAYADFVTAMMAFFMVMWIMGLSAADKAIVQGYFNDPTGFMKVQNSAKVNIAPPGGPPPSPNQRQGGGTTDDISQVERSNAGKLKEKIQGEVEKQLSLSGDLDMKQIVKHIKMSLTDEGLQIEFTEDQGMVFFESGSAVIRPAAAALLARVAPVLGRSRRRMIIDGHTDARPFPGTGYDNWDLSNDRATSIRHALTRSGVSSKQILAVRALADTKLKDIANPYNFVNRRVTVLLPYRANPEATFVLPGDYAESQIEGAFRQGISETGGQVDLLTEKRRQSSSLRLKPE